MLTTSPSLEDTAPAEGSSRLPYAALVSHLAHGWRAGAADIARDFISRWSARLVCETNIVEVDDSYVRFKSDLGAIRFAGMQEVECLLVSGHGEECKLAVDAFRRTAISPGRACMVLAASEEAGAAAAIGIPSGRCVKLGPEEMLKLLASEAPIDALKRLIRAQIPPRRLIPFDTEHPIDGHMFCGRTRYLSRLLEEGNTSFAVAGPGRIGKTSLMRRYRYLLLKARDSAWASTFYIDLMPCGDRTAEGLARFIAFKVDGTRRNAELTCDRLERFFTLQMQHYGRHVDLLLDETDEFLGLDTFLHLGNAARKGLCRLILGGRGNLLRTILGKDSPVQHRVDLLRLDPLLPEEAKALILGSLGDLGFSIKEPQQMLDLLCGLTGQLPHYLQYYGRRICELMAENPVGMVDLSLILRIRDEFETAKMFSDPIFEVEDPRSRLVALALLASGRRQLSLRQIQGVVYRQGLSLPLDELWEIVNELVIQSVLAWNQGKFQLANESLPHYAHSLDLFGSALREARAQAKVN